MVWTNDFICLLIWDGDKEQQHNSIVQEELKEMLEIKKQLLVTLLPFLNEFDWRTTYN